MENVDHRGVDLILLKRNLDTLTFPYHLRQTTKKEMKKILVTSKSIIYFCCLIFLVSCPYSLFLFADVMNNMDMIMALTNGRKAMHSLFVTLTMFPNDVSRDPMKKKVDTKK